MTLNPVKKLTPKQLNLAMQLNIFTGCLATVWGIVCSPQPIFNVFVINHLGASSSTLGFLVALLQISGLFQLASIFIYGYARRKKPFFIAAHLIHRLLTLAIAAAAFVAAATGNTDWGIRAIMIAVPLSWVFMNASAAGWWSWVADLFPEKIRGAFFLKRSAIINIINVIWFFLASMVLDLIKGPYTFWIYGAIFSIGAISGIVDIILNLFIPEPEPTETETFNPLDALEPLKNKNFIQFSVAVGIAIFSINLIGPFQSPYVVDPKGVAAPNTWLGIMFVISQLTWVVTAPFWGTIMDKWGRKPVVVLGCFFVLSWTGYFFLNHRTYIYLLPLISIAAGLLAPAFWEGVNQMMLSLSPNKNRIAYVAWYMTLVGLVSSGGSLLGGALLDALASFRIELFRLSFSGFHVVQFGSILMVLLSAWIISRVREGREQEVGFVIGRVANPGILKTYAYLDDIATATDPGRTEQALRSIEAETGDLALDEIIARLDDPYLEIREEAARALGRIGSAYAVEPLIQRLESNQSHFQITVARALGKIRDRRAVEPLIHCLKSTKSEELQEACIQALGDIGGEVAAQTVAEFYRNAASDRLRAAAADAASRLGLFEATSELLPRLIAGKSSSIRRQYAIALGNLFGPPGDFYPFVSGSEGASADRISRLFHQLEGKIRSTNFRLHKLPISKLSKHQIHSRITAIQEVREHLDAGQDLDALIKITRFAQDILAEILGEAVESRQFQELAFRIDIHFGSFVWFLEEVQKYLGTLPKSSPDEAEIQRLLALLIVFFLESNWN
ncbi:MFS transporter [Gracilinema caldarium]|uniref:MFS transporter n=1 Tax=Gracilinema caldarium TaxID=215591 RepID=UPI0026EE9C3B|nr:MFS transporter [Gracilinema caldarium]